MSFIQSFKRVFGFSTDENDFNIEEDDTPIKAIDNRTPYINPFKKETNTDKNSNETQISVATSNETPEISKEEIVELLIEEILKGVNSSLPEFIRNGIDYEAEKRHFKDSMGETLNGISERIKNSAESLNSSKWRGEIDSLKNTIKNLEGNSIEIAKKLENAKSQQTSLDRQKQALSKRVKDLEEHNLKAESDVEQYILENKSLLNKIKVMQVKGDDNNYYSEECERLKAELESLKKKLYEVTGNNDNQLNEELNQQNIALKKELEDRINEIQILKESIVALQQNAAISSLGADASNDEVISDLKSKLVLSHAELESSRSEIDNLRAEIEEANEALQTVYEIEKKLDKLESSKRKRDEKINILTEQLNNRDSEIKDLNLRISVLNQTINTLNAQPHTYSHRTSPKQSKAPTPQKKNNEVLDMSLIDDFFSVTEEPKVANYQSTTPILNFEEDEIIVEPIKKETIIDNSEENTIPIISAIDYDDNNGAWLKELPFDEMYQQSIDTTQEKDVEEVEIVKPRSFNDDSAQMSLF